MCIDSLCLFWAVLALCSVSGTDQLWGGMSTRELRSRAVKLAKFAMGHYPMSDSPNCWCGRGQQDWMHLGTAEHGVHRCLGAHRWALCSVWAGPMYSFNICPELCTQTYKCLCSLTSHRWLCVYVEGQGRKMVPASSLVFKEESYSLFTVETLNDISSLLAPS